LACAANPACVELATGSAIFIGSLAYQLYEDGSVDVGQAAFNASFAFNGGVPSVGSPESTEGAMCELTNTTRRGASETNYLTDQTAQQMQRALEENGYQGSSLPNGVVNYTKDSVSYSFYPERASVPGSSGAQRTMNGLPTTKFTTGQ
jgi:hypothetical protein